MRLTTVHESPFPSGHCIIAAVKTPLTDKWPPKIAKHSCLPGAWTAVEETDPSAAVTILESSCGSRVERHIEFTQTMYALWHASVAHLASHDSMHDAMLDWMPEESESRRVTLSVSGVDVFATVTRHSSKVWPSSDESIPSFSLWVGDHNVGSLQS
jgi:hypothetical protein